MKALFLQTCAGLQLPVPVGYTDQTSSADWSRPRACGVGQVRPENPDLKMSEGRKVYQTLKRKLDCQNINGRQSSIYYGKDDSEISRDSTLWGMTTRIRTMGPDRRYVATEVRYAAAATVKEPIEKASDI